MSSSSSSQHPREVLHLALGDEACHVSVHLQNLQGLAATNGTCAADVTHTQGSSYYAPRALLVPSSSLVTEQQKKPLTSPHRQQSAQQLAQSLAYGSHSRYRVPEKEEGPKQQQYQSTGRCVNWDDEEDEENDDESLLDEQRQRERNDWERNLQPTHDALDQFWSGFLDPTTTRETAATQDEQSPGVATGEKEAMVEISPTWRDFLVPPYAPSMLLTPPRTYFSATPDPKDDAVWVQDVLWEHVRQQLEACDACQGLMLFQSAPVSHWGTALLQEWRDECSSQSPLVGHFMAQQKEKEQRPGIDETVVTRLQSIVALDHTTDLADCVVPLRIPIDDATAAAKIAASWESITTPYRVNGSSSLSEIAVASSYHSAVDDAVPAHLSFRDFTRNLRRRQGRNLLHMSVYQNGDDARFYDDLLAGTSCERDQRMRQPNSTTAQQQSLTATPGSWMRHMESLLLSDSSGPSSSLDPSLHYHFSLATAVRPSTSRSAVFSGTSNLSTCLMQGMGIGYRPEQCMSSVVNQSLGDLTVGGYGAGSYWKHLLPGISSAVVSTLDNSTLIYPFVHATASQGLAILSSRRTSRERSIYQQHVGGILPEVDDMQTALEHVLDLRDAYTPPEGSGLVYHEQETAPLDY